MHPAHLCPACGYDLGFQAWTGDSASDEICPCCSIQFGYDDCAGGDLNKRADAYRQWREGWIAAGCPWRSKGMKAPDDWDPRDQLSRLNQ
jgi:hypothetical protein